MPSLPKKKGARLGNQKNSWYGRKELDSWGKNIIEIYQETTTRVPGLRKKKGEGISQDDHQGM